MPKKPGAKSTQKTYRLDQVSVGSFIFQQEEWLWRRKCSIEGCDHRMGPDTTQPRWALEWEDCDKDHLPAHLSLNTPGLESAGMACPCCVAKILAREP